ncbi:MAG: 30S ribosome-binding factor RbfA [Clostridia bacterium]|jgi:ribosome-binding factor A|nr:30S ribosome-binding factor RbfA [Clostridia bacterium]
MDRTVRIAAEMQRVISEIIRNDLKDPRIPLMTSVMNIKLAKDLKYAKVYVSVYGTEEEKKAAIAALKNSAGYIRREIGQRMIIRALPELTFTLDESLERGAYMSKLIDQVVKNDENKMD